MNRNNRDAYFSSLDELVSCESMLWLNWQVVKEKKGRILI